jgi:4-amino-4-deoxy-L-arabinose transferase-like glycosyltransferase
MNLHDATRRLIQAMLVLVALGLRVFDLASQSLWYDEAFSVLVARADWATAGRLLLVDLHPPLYYLVLRAGLAALGSSEFAVRFVSVIPAVLMVPLMWALARRLFDRLTAHLAAALVCLSPLFVWYAREARMYSQATMLGLAATYALVRAQDTGRARWWAAFATCALGAVYSHYSALYLVAALGLAWLVSLSFQVSSFRFPIVWRAARPGVLAFGVMALGVAVIAPFLLGLSQASLAYWPGQLDVVSALIRSVNSLVGGRTAPPQVANVLAVVVGALTLVALLGAVVFPTDRRGVRLAALVVVVGAALMLVVLYKRPKFEPRHLMPLAPAVWLLVAVGIRDVWRTRRRSLQAAVVSVVVVLVSGLAISTAGVFTGVAARDDWRGAVDYIRRNIRPDETIVLVSGHAFPALAYYNAPQWVALPDDLVLDVTHVLDYESVVPALNRIQVDQHGVWLVQWQDEIVDPTQIVPALLDDIGAELPPTEHFAGLRVRHFVLDRGAALSLEPQVARRLDRSPLPGLMALGVTLTPQPLPADAPLSVQMLWRADVPSRGAAGGSLRVMDAQGQEWARHDELLGGTYLSERWPLGRAVMGQYTLTLPIGTPPGNYTLRQVIYHGEQAGELDLGDLVVTRPVRAPDIASLGISLINPMRLGDLTLLGTAFDQKAIKPCEDLNLTLFWRSDKPPADDYVLRMTFIGKATDQPIVPGLPTSQWRSGDVWRTRQHITVPCRAPDGPANLQVALVDPKGQLASVQVSAGTVSVNGGRVYAPPAMQHRFLTDLGGQVRLVGYDIKPQTPNIKSQIELTLYWQATREMTRSLTVFTHVEGDQRRVWGQHDGPPALGLKPTDTWRSGEVVADRHILTFDPATPPGKYRLVIGMYDPVTLTRLPALDQNSRRWSDDSIFLQDIAVAR